MKGKQVYGLEGDGTLRSIQEYASAQGIDISKPSEKKIFDKAKLKATIRKKKTKGSGRHGVNPLNPNGYHYGYIHIFRG